MLIIFHKPKVPSINLIKSLKSNTWEFLIWIVDYIYICICICRERERERERERDVDGGGGGMVGFEPQIGDTIKNVARLSLKPLKIKDNRNPKKELIKFLKYLYIKTLVA